MIATLAELIAPISVAEFLYSFNARRRLHIPASDPARAQSLLSWQDIDTLLAMRARDDTLIVARDGVAIPKQLYTSGAKQEFNARAFHGLLEQGVSVVMNAIDGSVPRLAQLAAAVERETGAQTQVNAYLSFSAGGAFKTHWDDHDVLVVQIHGTKQWRIWNAVTQHPIEKTDRAKIDAGLPPDQEIELGPGDVLFIPRGEPHSAAVSGGHSVHLTIVLSSRTALDLIDQLRKDAEQVPLLRMNLPRHAAEPEAAEYEAAVKLKLHQLIDAASIKQFLRRDDLARSPVLQTAVTGAPPRTDDMLRLTLRRRIPLPDVAPDGAAQAVIIGGEMRSLAPTSIAVMRWLFDHDPASRRALEQALSSHYDQAAIETALRELSRFGFLVVSQAG